MGKRVWLRFSLLTLMVLAVWVACCVAVVVRWEPWIGIAIHSGNEVYISCSPSPDGKQILLPSEEGTVKIIDGKTGKLKFELKGHEGAVFSASWIKGGKQIISHGQDQIVRIWDAANGQELSQIRNCRYGLHLPVSPTEQNLIALMNEQNDINLLNFNSEKIQTTLVSKSEGYDIASFSPNGKVIAAGSSSGIITIHEISNGNAALSYKNHQDYIFSIRYSPDGKRIISSDKNGILNIWEVDTGKTNLTKRKPGLNSPIEFASFSPDGKKFIYHWAKLVKICDTANGKELYSLYSPGNNFLSAEFFPNGKKLVTNDFDGTIMLWVNRHPEYWYGHFYRPEVWLFLATTSLLAFRAFGWWRRKYYGS